MYTLQSVLSISVLFDRICVNFYLRYSRLSPRKQRDAPGSELRDYIMEGGKIGKQTNQGGWEDGKQTL